MSWGHLRLQRSPALAVPEPKIPQATCEQAGVWLFVPAWQAAAGRAATQRNLIAVAMLLSEQDAGVVGERLRIEGGAVGAAELGHPVLRLGRVRAVPAGVGAVEEIDVPRVLTQMEGVVVGVHEVPGGVPEVAGAGVGDGVGGLGHVGLVAVEFGYPHDVAA